MTQEPGQRHTVEVALAVEGDDVSFLVDVELAPVGDHIGCVSMTIRTYAHDEQEQQTHEHLDIPLASAVESEVTASLIRRIRVAELIQRAIAYWRAEADWHTSVAETFEPDFESWLNTIGWATGDTRLSGTENRNLDAAHEQFLLEEGYFAQRAKDQQWIRELPGSQPQRLGRPPIADHLLQRVGALHADAVFVRDRAPAKHVARELGISHDRARRWIMYARQRGHMPPAKGGPQAEEGQQ